MTSLSLSRPKFPPTRKLALVSGGKTLSSNFGPDEDYESATKKMNKRRENLPALVITKSSISLYSWEAMQKIAGSIRITSDNLVGSGTVNDPRMGVVSVRTPCPTCEEIDCPGHYGLIEFGVPIYNPVFIREIVQVLTCVCNDCGGLLITEDLVVKKGFHMMSLDKRLGQMEAYCKDNQCLRRNPQLGSGLVLPCDTNPTFITTDIKEKGEITFRRKENGNKIDREGPVKLMPINTVMNILTRISDTDARLLGFSPGSHPRDMIMMGCLVPPIIARPPIYEGGNKHHDKLTYMYIKIKHKVDNIKAGKNDALAELYTAIKELIYKTESNKSGMKDFLSIIERIQGKKALLREAMMGKRNNYCGRTVAGPDNSLEFGQVRLPIAWASILIKKVTVTDYNIKYLQTLFAEKKITHIITAKNKLREYYGNRPTYILQIGDKVERFLQDGDRVTINRQPTLHKLSMMAYEVVLGIANTIGLHLSYTSPMNCDFDGDENNTWVPQDFEVEAEAEIILNVKNNIMSAEQNRPVMGLVMNSISAAFLLTKANTIIKEDLFHELLAMITRKSSTLHQRLQKWGVHPYSGAAIFSAMLPETFYYRQKGVFIVDGILISGRLKKSSVGASHRSIIQDIYSRFGVSDTVNFFTDAPWILNKWVMERGFSVGLLDMLNLGIDKNNCEYDKNLQVLNKELANIYVQIEALGPSTGDPLEDAFRIKQITNLSNIANGIGIRLADGVLSKNNSIGVMTEKGAGTKGAVANIGQMMGAVGQQFYQGKRLEKTIDGGRRLLPIYDRDDNDPRSHAFIANSFFTGLTEDELFLLQAGGRENLLDTALKTQDTGSMQHKMIKAFENIVIGYDGSIRNTIGTLFSTIYNSGYDVGEMMMVDYPGQSDFSSFIDIKSLAEELNFKRGWAPKILSTEVKKNQDKYYEGKVAEIEIAVEYEVKIPLKLKINKFEKSRIIAARAMQLSNNSTPIIGIGDITDPIKIALMEYDTGLLKIYVIRKYPDGSYEKIYPTTENIN